MNQDNNEKKPEPAVAGQILKDMLESRKAAKDLVMGQNSIDLPDPHLMTMAERLAKRAEIYSNMTQEEINAAFATGHIPSTELVGGLGMQEVIYSKADLSPEILGITHKDIGGYKIPPADLPVSITEDPPVSEDGIVLRRGPNRRKSGPGMYGSAAAGSYDWDRASPEIPKPVKFLGVFKERTPGVYSTGSGLIAKEEMPEHGEYNEWVIRDRDGKELARTTYLFDFMGPSNKVGEFYSYNKRTGRQGDTESDIKYGAAHFPPGTVFQVRNDVKITAFRDLMKPYEGMDTFTVRHISYNGPRSVLITTVEECPDIIDENKTSPHQFVSSHVIKIIKRGPGKVVFGDHYHALSPFRQTFEDQLAKNDQEMKDLFKREGHSYPKLKRGEHLFYSPSSVIGLVNFIGNPFEKGENEGKFVNERLLEKFLRSTNCMRYIHVSYVGDWSFGFFAINVKKWGKWLKKNSHRIFYNLDQCEQQEREEDARRSDEMEDMY